MEKDGWSFVIPAGVLMIGFAAWGLWTGDYIVYGFAAFFAVMTGFLAFFFRDPQRQPPEGSGWVVSPADGKILSIDTDPDGRRRIAIFLSVFDVHVNRAPIAGTVDSVQYRPGRYFKAFDPRASKENEQAAITVSSPSGPVEFALIAGILARRVVCRIETGQMLQLGQRVGLIRFGSRAEVVLSPDVSIMVHPGDRVKGCATPLARFAGKDSNG